MRSILLGMSAAAMAAAGAADFIRPVRARDDFPIEPPRKSWAPKRRAGSYVAPQRRGSKQSQAEALARAQDKRANRNARRIHEASRGGWHVFDRGWL